jgi:hypothetical protein
VLSLSGASAVGCGSPAITPVDGGRDAGPRTDSAVADAGPRPDGGPVVEDGGVDTDGGDVDSDGGDGGIGGDDGGGEIPVPATYAFDSRFEPGTSSVSYSGQVARQVLALDLRRFIDSRETAINDPVAPYVPRDVDEDGTATMAETVLADLLHLVDDTAAERAEDPHGIVPPASTTLIQETYGDLSATAYLRDKIAGNDASTDHRVWSTDFVGFSDGSGFRAAAGVPVDVSSPTGLLMAIFTTIAANAQDAYDTNPRLGPGSIELRVHETAEGLHLGQLAEKFLLGAINFSQGADDYLDDEAEDVGKGLLSPNTRDTSGGTPRAYTTLEHAWDEGYGYFGAPRHAATIDLATLIGDSRFFDGNADSMIDLTSEYLFPTARYAALREDGAADGAPAPFFTDAERAFRAGRTIIANAGETLTEEELGDLREQRDIVVRSWEGALAASTITYLNRVIQSTLAIDAVGASYDFRAHIGAWSELKAFSLAYQFHRGSPMLVEDAGEERFVTFHALIGDAPVLSTATPAARVAYVADLIAARTLLADAYGMDPANVGDAMGTGGF